jgi:hypothetical protein
MRGPLVALGVALASTRAGAQLASVGAACQSRAECQPGLRCVHEVCADESALPRAPDDKHADALRDIRYVGGALGVSLPAIWGTAGEGFQLGVSVGAIIGENLQLQLDVSPATTVFTNILQSGQAFNAMDATASIGLLAPLNDFVSWIVRFGGGGGALLGIPTFDPVTQTTRSSMTGFAELRADVVGVLIRTSKHLLVDIDIPSFRVLFMTSQASTSALFMWVTNVAVSYVF